MVEGREFFRVISFKLHRLAVTDLKSGVMAIEIGMILEMLSQTIFVSIQFLCSN